MLITQNNCTDCSVYLHAHVQACAMSSVSVMAVIPQVYAAEAELLQLTVACACMHAGEHVPGACLEWAVSTLWLSSCRVMQQNQEYIPNVLAVFLGDSGMGHSDEVSSLSPACPTLHSQLCAKPSPGLSWEQALFLHATYCPAQAHSVQCCAVSHLWTVSQLLHATLAT